MCQVSVINAQLICYQIQRLWYRLMVRNSPPAVTRLMVSAIASLALCALSATSLQHMLLPTFGRGIRDIAPGRSWNPGHRSGVLAKTARSFQAYPLKNAWTITWPSSAP